MVGRGCDPSEPGRRGRRQPGTPARPTAGAGGAASRARGASTGPAGEGPSDRRRCQSRSFSALALTVSNACDRINQVVDVVRAAVEVLGQELQPEVAGEDPCSVALRRPDRPARDGRARRR